MARVQSGATGGKKSTDVTRNLQSMKFHAINIQRDRSH